jgi:acetyltransferase-like isoleucine patch superfamily enzyme
MNQPRSLGDGRIESADLAGLGEQTVVEPGVRIFGPEWIQIGDQVYIGHDCLLRAYSEGSLIIGDRSWLGPGCFINSFGRVTIGKRVGIGPGVKILSSFHGSGDQTAIIDRPLVAKPVVVEDGADIGAGAILLAGSVIGAAAQVGAGAVVKGRVEPRTTVAGVPARKI